MDTENRSDMGLDSITGRPSDGSTMTGAEKGKKMALGEYKALQNQVVRVGEGNVQLGMLLTDLVVRIAHLSGLDPEQALTAERDEAVALDEKIHEREEQAHAAALRHDEKGDKALAREEKAAEQDLTRKKGQR
jgi:hypothetical protein